MRITPNDTVTADKAVIPALLATNIPSIAVFSAFNNNESTAGACLLYTSFGNNIIPNLLRDGRRMYAYHFNGYWKDVGTISSLWEANMEVLDPEHSGINLFDENWKIYSRNSGMTGHKISGDALVENSMITDGCRINGQVRHSILFSGVKVEAGAQVEDAVVMGSTTIKSGAVVKHCIVAENVVIGENAVVGAMPSDSEKGVATIGPGIEDVYKRQL